MKVVTAKIDITEWSYINEVEVNKTEFNRLYRLLMYPNGASFIPSYCSYYQRYNKRAFRIFLSYVTGEQAATITLAYPSCSLAIRVYHKDGTDIEPIKVLGPDDNFHNMWVFDDMVKVSSRTTNLNFSLMYNLNEISLNESDWGNIYLGENKVKEMYLGSQLVYGETLENNKEEGE